MRTRLLALGAAAGLAVLVALPAVAAAIPSQMAASSAAPPATVSTTSVSAANQSARSASDQLGPAGHNGTSVTVTGPHMCICTVNDNAGTVTNSSDNKRASTVTVSQTTNLTHQTVQVSWTRFTPSDNESDGPIYVAGTNLYPVMAVECKGYHPASLSDCYDTGDNGTDNPPPTYYQNNPAFAVTAANGTGEADVQVVTSLQVQTGIYCDLTHPCSLVVVPAQGGLSNSDCSHSQDANTAEGNIPNAVGEYDFTINPQAVVNPWRCSWDKKIVIPLHFAPALDNCPQRTPDFTAEGSPMLADAMTQWQTSICTGANSVVIGYNGTNNENEARSDFQSGATDVAFTTLPLTGPAAHPFTYAPVAVSGVSVAFWADNFNTGLPYTTVKLTPLLLAKQMTTSYNYGGYGCTGPPKKTNPSPKATCDSAVNNNPQSIFDDPGFLKYNPGPWALDTLNPAFDTPDVVAGNSDMTWVTTGWVAASKDATAFLKGTTESGVHVNSDYVGTKFPVDLISPRDPFANMANQYQPQFPLYNVVEDLVSGQPPGVDPAAQQPGDPTVPPWPTQSPGQRELWAVVDQGDAALNLFPVSYLQNAAGKFVQPTVSAMTAAVKDMTVNPDGITLSMNFAKKDPAAYPLTMVIYAAVPTGGIPQAKAAAIARFLDYVANRGQQPGTTPGDLAPGYAPLPQSLRQQTLAAAYKVLHQTGNAKKKTTTTHPSTSPSPSPSTSKSASPSPSPSKSKSASPSPSPKASASSTPTATSIAVSFSSPDGTGMSWVVFALILAGAVLLVTGPAALIVGSPGARAAIGSGARRISRLASRTRNQWRGAPRPPWRRNS